MTRRRTKTQQAPVECAFCTGGFILLEPHEVLGTLVRHCPLCQLLCDGCLNTATFPMSTTCLGCWQDELAAKGIFVGLCRGCLGGKHYIRPIGGIPPHAHLHTCT
ncbi:hypothetical protein Rhe02_83690 [Rhizocola hellebori]|uniref:Uncharacterized protein n=1 Tax=Rhizocola hellebori TaxID=1392758 RepID=A0A8J3VL65_9ACTN|nr:hypothetical protein Rhe02_83690 [Rhizocola hellebori]